MRLATVVSQAPGVTIASRSCSDIAYHREYVAWTTSSASTREPRSRYATLMSWCRSLSVARSARFVRLGRGSDIAIAFDLFLDSGRHQFDEVPPRHVTPRHRSASHFAVLSRRSSEETP